MTSIVGTPQVTDSGFLTTRNGIALPAGIQTGDVIFFVLTTANDHTLASIPAGVSQAGTTQNAPSDDSSTSVLYRISDGSEGATYDLGTIYSVTESGGVLAFALRGLNSADLIEAIAQSAIAIASNGEVVSGPTLTPANNNCAILQIIGYDPGAAVMDGTPDAGLSATEVFDGKFDTGDFAAGYVQLFDQTTAAAVALDATFDIGPTNFSVFQIALNTVQGPGISITQTELTPGATITGSGANYDGIPANGSNVTISDGTNNLTAVLTITNGAAGAFDFSFTMPTLPATGATASRIKFDSTAVTVTIPDPGA